MLFRNAIRKVRGHLRIGSRTDSGCIETPTRPAGAGIAVVLILRRPHCLEPLRHRHRVAVVAAGRKAVTASRGIPRDLCPFDLRGAQDIALLDRVRDTHRTRLYGHSPAEMTADPKLTPPERSATQGRSFAAAECTAYLSVVWRAVDVEATVTSCSWATGAPPRGPSWGFRGSRSPCTPTAGHPWCRRGSTPRCTRRF
jgi:hypothetical protein